MQEKILLFFLKKEFFHIGVVYLDQEDQEKTKTDMNEIIKYIAKEEIDLNEELFKKIF